MHEHVFVERVSGNHKGAIAEAKIAAAAIELGVRVLKPMSEHGRYDLVFDLGHHLVRVQCTWATCKGDVIRVHLGGSYLSARGYVRSTYASDEVDAIAAYCADLDECYVLPIELVAGHHQVHLRLVPPKNGQRAALIWAADHRLPGAVAQLGERRSGTPKATGSSPVSSTHSAPTSHTVGAHEFRNHFGWYMERTVAGEEFVVTRRGKPCVRLVPAHAQLPIAG